MTYLLLKKPQKLKNYSGHYPFWWFTPVNHISVPYPSHYSLCALSFPASCLLSSLIFMISIYLFPLSAKYTGFHICQMYLGASLNFVRHHGGRECCTPSLRSCCISLNILPSFSLLCVRIPPLPFYPPLFLFLVLDFESGSGFVAQNGLNLL